jgi:hypothetical protein
VALTRSTEVLAGLHDCLLTQVDAADADSVREGVSRPGGGFVLVGEDALTRASELSRTGCVQPILADLRRYAGQRRVPGTARFQPRWILAQQHLGLPAILTDSGYVGDDDAESLDSILGQAGRLGSGVIATLPMHVSWLERKRSQERLIAAIRDAGVPVAFIFEHAKDPLAKKAALFGFVNVLRSVDVPVLLLRCDVSALGALAFGAHAAAIGTTTGLRHLFKPGKGGRPDGIESALLKDFLAFIKVGKIAQAVEASPDDPMWVCWCRFCSGRSLDWLLTATSLEVRGHSIELLGDLRDQLTQVAPGSAREQSWKALCASAQFRHENLDTYDIFWETPPAIRRWQEV